MNAKDIPGIDLPIVPILNQLNALGFETSWSCCGYNYPGQGKKDHDQAHVRIECFKARIDTLLDVLERGWWRIEYLGGNYWALWAPSQGVGCFSCAQNATPKLVKECWSILEKALNQISKKEQVNTDGEIINA